MTSHFERNYLVFTHQTTTYLFDTDLEKEVFSVADTVAFIGLVSRKIINKSNKCKAVMTCLRKPEELRRKQKYSVSVSLI